MDVYGTIDELNSAIGFALCAKTQALSMRKELIKIQNDLFEVGFTLANSKSKPLNYLKKRVKEFENFIDQMAEQMPKLSNFILPGGGETGATLHLARVICRRAERVIVKLNSKHPSTGSGQVDGNIIIYFNRLSDLLFTMARFVNFKEKKKEIIWSKRTGEQK